VSYLNYGIERELVERIKFKLKNPALKDRVKAALHGVTKADLQNRAKVGLLLGQICAILGESLSDRQRETVVSFVIAQRIDPNNTFHLIKLWNMFR
jgi:hypothetical protein